MKRRAVVLLLGTALAGCSGGSGRSTAAEASLRDRAEAGLASDGAWARSTRGIDVEWETDGYRVRVEYVLDYGTEQSAETIRERADATAIRVLERLFAGEASINRAAVVAFTPGAAGNDGSTEEAAPLHVVEVTGVTASTTVWESLEAGDLEGAADVYTFRRDRVR